MVRRNPARGFTILELLVVVTIIAVLVAILIPTFAAAKETAKIARCQANLRQLGLAFMSFGTDHWGKLPGCKSQYTEGGGTLATTGGTDPNNNEPALVTPENYWMSDWVAGTDKNYTSTSATDLANLTGFYAQPSKGTIYPYVSSPKAFLCPTLAKGKYNSGVGSNGQFDYTYPQLIQGSRAESVGRIATATSGGFATNPKIQLPTPILCEEDPGQYANSGFYTDGSWCWYDHTTLNHKKGTNIATIDGSTFWFKPPPNFTLEAGYVLMQAPSGSWQNGQTDNKPWGWFSKQ
jgi:prepilin-type N-terminal cleavage/methylation domain-containing protein